MAKSKALGRRAQNRTRNPMNTVEHSATWAMKDEGLCQDPELGLEFWWSRIKQNRNTVSSSRIRISRRENLSYTYSRLNEPTVPSWLNSSKLNNFLFADTLELIMLYHGNSVYYKIISLTTNNGSKISSNCWQNFVKTTSNNNRFLSANEFKFKYIMEGPLFSSRVQSC